jgi:excisionase family DNA binding protein
MILSTLRSSCQQEGTVASAVRSLGDDNLDLKGAARRLGVSRHTLRTWSIYQHRLPFLRLGKRILFKPADLLAFEEQGRVPAKPETNGR